MRINKKYNSKKYMTRKEAEETENNFTLRLTKKKKKILFSIFFK